MQENAHRAEYKQAIQAFLIPSSLFVATVISAAGVFLLYSGYALGYAFLATSAAIMIAAFVAFFRFQNKLRASGKYLDPPDNGPMPDSQ